MTTAVLRPNTTDRDTGTTGLVGAASPAAALSDESDSSYIYGIPITDNDYGLTTVALPAGAIVKQARTRIRQWRVDYSITVYTFIGADSYAGVSTAGSGDSDGTWRNVDGAWRTLTGITQADVDAAYVRPYMGGIPENSYLAGIYVDLVYVAKPTVTVAAVTPDPLTATNVVPLSWSRTLDADGGAQTRYRVKVYNSTQYGAGGFDPATYAGPVYDSGEALGAGTTATTGPLTNATYRAYVQVAQTVNGISHWSAWAYDQFIINVASPAVQSVTTTASNTLGRIQVDVARNTGGVAWEWIEVERSVDGMVTWQPVRGATFVAASGNSFQVFDFEVANGVNARYRARASRFVSGLQMTSAWVSNAANVSWTSALCFLKAPLNPALNTTIKLKSMFEPRRARPSGVFPIVAAAEPVVVSDVLSARTGILDIHGNLADASLEPLLQEAALLLHPPAGWYFPNMHFVATSVEFVRGARIMDTKARWILDIVETKAPADPTAGI